MTENIQKRKVADIILWGLFVVPILACICYLTFLFCDYEDVESGFAIGIGIGAAVLTLGIGVNIALLSLKTRKHTYSKLAVAAPFLTVVITLGLRVWYLLCGNGYLTGNIALYRDTMITEDAFHMVDFVSDPFTFMIQGPMRLAFRLFGNTEDAVAFTFLVLQTVMVIAFYYAIRNFSGHLAAFVASLLVFANPDAVMSIYDISNQNGLMICFTILLLFDSLLMRVIRKSGKSFYLLLLVLFGIANGILFHYDILFASNFVLLLLCFITYKSDAKQKIYKSFLIIIHVLSFVAGFFLKILQEFLDGSEGFADVLYNWYCKVDYLWNPDEGIVIAGDKLLYLIIPAVFVGVFVFSFWFVRYTGKTYLGYYITTIGVLCVWMLTDSEYAGLMSFVYLCIMAGVVLQICMRSEKPLCLPVDTQPENEEAVPVDSVIADSDKTQATAEPDLLEDVKDMVVTDLGAEVKQERKVVKPLPGQPLDNPLAGPKKHVRRELDFAVSVPEDKMNYDIETNEQDDYDI